jgi:hypothetical protein
MRPSLVLAAAAALCLLVTAPAQARKMSTTYMTILSPKTATKPTGVTHTVTATVMRHTENCDPDGQTVVDPHAGATVKFEVVSGPNAGLGGTDTTDLQGHAQFSYTSQKTGTDTLVATPMGLTNKGVCNADPGPAGPSGKVDAIWVAPRDDDHAEPPVDDGCVHLKIDDVRVVEGDTDWSPATQATFTVSMSQPSAVPVTVEFATLDGTATDAWDYAPRVEKLTFDPGDPLTQKVTILVRGEQADEPDEWFGIELSNPTNALIGDSLGIGTIVDDDPGLTNP